MATLPLTGNVGQLLVLAKNLSGALAGASESKIVTVTIDDSDFSITYTDGAYGAQKKKAK